jgi:hypothetical protein
MSESQYEWYSLNAKILAFTIPHLEYFIENSMSVPVDSIFPCRWQFFEDDEYMRHDLYLLAEHIWFEYLNRMLWSFKYFLRKDDIGMPRWNTPERQMMEQRYKEGMALFAKYFKDLWD